MKKVIVLVGNLCDGYTAFGPYDNFDDAAAAHPGADTWMMTLEEPIRRVKRFKSDTNKKYGAEAYKKLLKKL